MHGGQKPAMNNDAYVVGSDVFERVRKEFEETKTKQTLGPMNGYGYLLYAELGGEALTWLRSPYAL
jgi:hypothetical protein